MLKRWLNFLLMVNLASYLQVTYADIPNSPLILGYWGNWHVWDADKNRRPTDEYQIPGSKNKDNGATVTNLLFQKQMHYANAVAYAFLEVYPDVGMYSNTPQKTVDEFKRGVVYFSDPWTDLFNNTNTTQFCRTNATSCYFAYQIEKTSQSRPAIDVAQPWNYFYMGNFDAFTRLSGVKRIISIGGWYHEKGFEEGAFRNPVNFANSIVAIINKAKANGGNIDGVDLDYEPPTGYAAANAELLVKTVQQLRQTLNANGLSNVMITVPVFANINKLEQFGRNNLVALAQQVNYIGLMGYDYHGEWDTYTGLQSNLYPTDAETSSFSSAAAVEALVAMGVPASKIVLGIPSYGRAVGGVIAGDQFGLNQALNPSLTPQADWGSGQVSYYQLINQWMNHGYFEHTLNAHEQSNGVWAYNPTNQQFVSYDNTAVIDAKAAYVLEHHLGGMMMWELLGDVSPEDVNGLSLLKHMSDGLK